MTLTEARAAIMAVVAQMQIDHTAYPLVVETSNRDVVDQALQVKPYLKVTVAFMGGDQMDMADKPRIKQHGQVLLCAVAKGGSGEAEALELLDFITPYFDLARLGSIECHACTAVDAKEDKGWWHAPAIVDFYYTRIKK